MPPGTPCAAANTLGGINSSPTHCPQTTACMAGRRGRRPLRRLARKRLAGGARCAPPSARPLHLSNVLPCNNGTRPRNGQDRSAGWVGVGGLARRGGIHAARDVCGVGSSAGRIYAAPTNRSEKWRLRVVCRGGIHASRKPSAATNTPGGINPSPTHCPQTTACMAGRRGRRPLRRNVFLFVPSGTNSTFFIIYYLLSLIYLLFAPFVV